MQRPVWSLCAGLLFMNLMTAVSFAGQPLTWQEVRDKFLSANPSLQAARIGVEESRAQEITAYLRPNPNLTASMDYMHPFRSYGSVQDAQPSVMLSYLFERMNKRELRKESAEKGTAVALAQAADLERNLLFNLRGAFIQVLQHRAILALARENPTYSRFEQNPCEPPFPWGP